MSVAIRRARTSETAALHALAAATFPLACPPGTSEADSSAFVAAQLSEARFAEYLADPSRTILVAEQGGVLVGYTLLVAADPSDADVARAVSARPTAELSKCYVMPDAHGSGVASLLVAATVEAADAGGARSVWLGVNQENLRANRFYEKSGFERVGAKRFTVGSRTFDDWVRERPLP